MKPSRAFISLTAIVLLLPIASSSQISAPDPAATDDSPLPVATPQPTPAAPTTNGGVVIQIPIGGGSDQQTGPDPLKPLPKDYHRDRRAHEEMREGEHDLRKGIHEEERGMALIDEGKKEGGPQGRELEGEGKSLVRAGEHEVRDGERDIHRARRIEHDSNASSRNPLREVHYREVHYGERSREQDRSGVVRGGIRQSGVSRVSGSAGAQTGSTRFNSAGNSSGTYEHHNKTGEKKPSQFGQ